MKFENQPRKFWLGTVFEPRTDFYELLKQQAAKTLEGMEALDAWVEAGGGEELGQRVRDLEKEADELKLSVGLKLVESFVTPIDREDIYDLSARMDEIINAAKATVREVEALEVPTDNKQMREMSEVLKEGSRCLYQAFASLKHDKVEASSQAALARKSENRFTKLYRQAMRLLFSQEDMKMILRTTEVYKQMLAAAEKIDAVAEKLMHVIVKIS